MTVLQQIITIALCALGTMMSRFTPFVIFSGKKHTPKFIDYLGNALPGAAFGILVVYCLKDINFLHGNHGIPEIIAILLTFVLHKWKHKMMVSIVGGTVCYMALIRFI